MCVTVKISRQKVHRPTSVLRWDRSRPPGRPQCILMAATGAWPQRRRCPRSRAWVCCHRQGCRTACRVGCRQVRHAALCFYRRRADQPPWLHAAHMLRRYPALRVMQPTYGCAFAGVEQPHGCVAMAVILHVASLVAVPCRLGHVGANAAVAFGPHALHRYAHPMPTLTHCVACRHRNGGLHAGRSNAGVPAGRRDARRGISRRLRRDHEPGSGTDLTPTPILTVRMARKWLLPVVSISHDGGLGV